MNKGFVKLSVLFAGLLALVGIAGYLLSANTSNVEATVVLEDWSCKSNGEQCGTNEGTEYVCPEGYERHGNSCKKWVETTYTCDVHEWIHYVYRDVSSFYNKPTGDDNHCHRINWNDLTQQQKDYFDSIHPGTPSVNDYNNHIDENPEADVDVAGHWEYTDKVSQKCTAGEPRYDACDPAGQCSDKCGITEPYEVPDGQGGFIQCGTTPACEEDQCDNLEGMQATVPDGYTQSEVEEELVCTPNPTPEVRVIDEHPSAPACPNGVPVLVPVNPHVVRNGSDATVNAHIPEGDKVNIYFKENGETSWKHAVADIQVTGKYVSYTIHDLNPALGYTFGIQAGNGCAGGEVVLAVIVDPPAFGVVFPFSYYEWLR